MKETELREEIEVEEVQKKKAQAKGQPRGVKKSLPPILGEEKHKRETNGVLASRIRMKFLICETKHGITVRRGDNHRKVRHFPRFPRRNGSKPQALRDAKIFTGQLDAKLAGKKVKSGDDMLPFYARLTLRLARGTPVRIRRTRIVRGA